MKKTAVEWLIEEYINGAVINIQIMKKALEMEKEQIKDAYESLEHRHGENYYNAIYKTEQ